MFTPTLTKSKAGATIFDTVPSGGEHTHVENEEFYTYFSPSKRFRTQTARTESTEASNKSQPKDLMTKIDMSLMSQYFPVKLIKIKDHLPNRTLSTTATSPRSFQYNSSSSSPKNYQPSGTVRKRITTPQERSPLVAKRNMLFKSLRNQNKKDQAILDFMKQQSKEEKSIETKQLPNTRDNSQLKINEVQGSPPQETRKQFLKGTMKQQKEALQQYLLGNPVDHKIIDSHKDLIYPINYSIYLKKKRIEQKKMAREQNKVEEETFEIVPKIFLKKNKHIPVKNLTHSQTEDLMYIQAQEKDYFQSLENLRSQAAQEFQETSTIRQKYWYDNIAVPEQQFICRKEDMHLNENPSKMQEIIQNLKYQRLETMNSLQDNITHFLSIHKKRKEKTIVGHQSNNDSQYLKSAASPQSERIDSASFFEGREQIRTRTTTIDKKNANKFSQLVRIKLLNQDQDQSDQVTSRAELNNSSQQPQPSKMVKQKSQFLDRLLNRYISNKEHSLDLAKDAITQKKQINAVIAGFTDSHNHLLNVSKQFESIGEPLTEEERNIFNMVKKNQINQVKELIDANPLILLRQDETGKSLLHWAAMRGHGEITTYLISMKANIHLHDIRFKTPKNLAQEYNHFQVLGILSKEEHYQKQLNHQADRPTSRRGLLKQFSIQVL